MRWLFRLFIVCLVLTPLGLIAVAVMCVESSPLVGVQTQLNVANIERAKRVLLDHDPRKLRNNEVKSIVVSEEELTLVANHLINRIGAGSAVITLNTGELILATTIDLSLAWPGRYLNVEAVVNETAGTPRFERLTIGRLALPHAVIGPLAAFIVEHIYRASGVHNVHEVIQAVEIRPQRLTVTYQWKAGLTAAIRDRIVSAEDRQKLGVYNRFLAAEVERQGSGASFADLLKSLFGHARDRSAPGQAVAENRAVILVLAAYVDGRSLTTLAPEAVAWVKPKRLKLRLHGRNDFVSHFMTSAALAVTGGSAVSNAIGLYKEIDDADGGSGFSFKDLAADMAGTRFGQLAVTNESTASALQQRISGSVDDLMLIPEVKGLQENLSNSAFKRRYDGVGGRRYLMVVSDIEQRIAHSALYR
ncbi:MAG: hypothetical protein E2O36_05055 [Proteobacteria bacterium]|nr:MAG: hypothetical protein E2O36_05055 [Pseudomonadota bacterium]